MGSQRRRARLESRGRGGTSSPGASVDPGHPGYISRCLPCHTPSTFWLRYIYLRPRPTRPPPGTEAPRRRLDPPDTAPGYPHARHPPGEKAGISSTGACPALASRDPSTTAAMPGPLGEKARELSTGTSPERSGSPSPLAAPAAAHAPPRHPSQLASRRPRPSRPPPAPGTPSRLTLRRARRWTRADPGSSTGRRRPRELRRHPATPTAESLPDPAAPVARSRPGSHALRARRADPGPSGPISPHYIPTDPVWESKRHASVQVDGKF